MKTIKEIIRNSKQWAWIKAKIQESHILSEQQYYDNKYFEIYRTEKIDEDKIIEQIKSKIQNKVVTKKIHFIYLVSRPDTWEDINIPPALQKIGSYDLFYLSDNNQKSLRKKIIEAKKDDKTTIFLSCLSKADGLDKEFFLFLDTQNIMSMIFSLDDQHNFSGKRLVDGSNGGNRDIAKYIDVCLTSSKNSIKKYIVEGGRALYMPEGANLDIFAPIDVEKIYDVVFVGVVYGYRKILIDYLISQGIRVEVFGKGSKNGPVSFEDMVKIWNQSKIVLGHGGMGYSHLCRTLKGRDFEVPACCVPYITTRYSELEAIYTEDNEMLFYDTKEECAAKIKSLLNNEMLLDSINSNLEKQREKHSWENRFCEISRLIF